VLVATAIGAFLLVSSLFLSQMQKRGDIIKARTEVLKNNKIYEEDEDLATKLAYDRERICKFTTSLMKHTHGNEPLKDFKYEIDELMKKLCVKPKSENK